MPHGRQTDGTADNPHAGQADHARRHADHAGQPDGQHPQTEPRQGREKL